MLAAARMNDCRSTDNESFATVLFVLKELLSDLSNGNPFGFLGRNSAVHELEGLRRCGSLFGEHTNSSVTDNEQLACLNFVHWHAASGVWTGVDGDAAIHFLPLNLQPFVPPADLGSLIGGA